MLDGRVLTRVPRRGASTLNRRARCVGAGQLGIQRLPAAQADSGGQLTIALDYASLAFLPISAGSTWYFQAWYADGGQPMGAGLSDALELVFVP